MIKKGEDWGRAGKLSDPSLVFASDRALGQYLATAGPHPPVAAVSEGDLARTLGLKGDRDATQAEHVVAVDALRVVIDEDAERLAMAHVVVGHLLRTSGCVAVMNAAFIGALNVAPRSHPGDGKVDVVTFSMALADRIKAHRRMPLGTHVPHPKITTRRQARGDLEFHRTQPVRIDGQRVGRARRLRFEVIPAAIELAL